MIRRRLRSSRLQRWSERLALWVRTGGLWRKSWLTGGCPVCRRARVDSGSPTRWGVMTSGGLAMFAAGDVSRALGGVNVRRRRRAAVRTVAVGLGLALLLGTIGSPASPAMADAVTDVVPVG